MFKNLSTSKLKCIITWIFVGILCFVFGLFIYFIIPVIVRHQVRKMLPLRNGTLIFQQWQNPTVPAYMQFWFFDVLNPDAILDGDKPSVRQIGPYTYREYRIKYNIVFDANGTVSYLQKRLYFFEPSLSVGYESDTFTTANIPYIVLGTRIKDYKEINKLMVENSIKDIKNYSPFIKTSVKNITWGYTDPFLEANKLILNGFGFRAEPNIGLFYGKNNTNDKVYKVDTGNINLDNYLKIESWNGSSKLSMWNNDYANMVNGTDGSMFGPFLNKSSRLYIFQSDICRTIHATYVGSDVIKGIPSFNYAAPSYLFANHTVNPDNKGFCLDGYCLGAGVLNLTKCVPGSPPIVMSQPHFSSADPKYHQSIIGLNPSKEYKTILKLEPTTGLPLQIQKKLQINIALESITALGLENLPSVLLPVMWLNESVLITDDLARKIKNRLLVPVSIGQLGALALMVCGILVVILIVLNQLNPVRYRRSIKFKLINTSYRDSKL